MDKIFARFIENFGPPIDRREVPPSTIDRYRDKLPPKLLEYWSEHGWSGYGEGIFWLVNPQEYDAVVSYWIAGTTLGSHDNYHLIARSAFGDLYLWGEKSGFSLKITSIRDSPNKLPTSRKWTAWRCRKPRFSAADYWKTKA